MCLRCADPLSEGLATEHSRDERHLNPASDRRQLTNEKYNLPQLNNKIAVGTGFTSTTPPLRASRS
jgi:hypothetical protein